MNRHCEQKDVHRHCEQKGRLKRWGEAISTLFGLGGTMRLLRQLTHRPMLFLAMTFAPRHCEPACRTGREERRKPARLPAGNLLVVIAERLLLRKLAARNDVVAIILVLISLSSHATIHTVKQDGTGEHTTIQAGINAASTGDTVLVWPGTYFENIDYNSKSLTVGSLYLTTQDESLFHSTFIDGNMNGSCVFVQDCTGDSTAICGFTIQHGSGYSNLMSGGGLYIESSFIKIESCIIRRNISRTGGGVFGLSSEIYLIGSVVKQNRAITYAGGVLLTNRTLMYFDTVNLNSIYLNYGPRGCDFTKSASCPPLEIVLDTGTVLIPDNFFYFSYDPLGLPLNDIAWQINHGKIEQVTGNLFVSPNCDNSNSGLNQDEPLKSICYAVEKFTRIQFFLKQFILLPEFILHHQMERCFL